MGTINPRATLPLRLRADHTLSLTGIGDITSNSRSFKVNGTLTIGPYDEDVDLVIAASPDPAGVTYSNASVFGTGGGGSSGSADTAGPITGLTYNTAVTPNLLTGYTQGGVTYTLTYVTVAGTSVVSTKAGGGHITTNTWVVGADGLPQLTGQTYS